MIIRNGEYTIWSEYDFALYEVRLETPIPFTHFILKWYLNEPCPIVDFELNIHGDIIKVLEKNEVRNAYSVRTQAQYHSHNFDLWGFNKKRNCVALITHSLEIAEELKFLTLSDRFIKEVNPKELELVWEERSESQFDLPMPSGIERKKIINLNE